MTEPTEKKASPSIHELLADLEPIERVGPGIPKYLAKQLAIAYKLQRTGEKGDKGKKRKMDEVLYVFCRRKGLPIADCASYAGSKQMTRNGLAHAGRDLEKDPRVAAALKDINKLLDAKAEAAWFHHVDFLYKTSRGDDPYLTTQDRLSAGAQIGRAIGAFQDKVQITGVLPGISFMSGKVLKPEVPAEESPALPSGGGEEREEAVEVEAESADDAGE